MAARSRSSPRSAAGSQSPQPRPCSSGRTPWCRHWRRIRSARGARPEDTVGGHHDAMRYPPTARLSMALFCCPFSGGALIPLLRSPSSASDGPSGEAAGMETNKWRLTLDLASTFQRRLKVWRSRASACAGAVKPPSTGRPTKGEADTPFLGGAMRHSRHALGAPPRRSAVRPRLRPSGFSSRAGPQVEKTLTLNQAGLSVCLAHTRSTRCRRRGTAFPG